MKTIELDRRELPRSAALGSAGALLVSSLKLIVDYSKMNALRNVAQV